jgi:hypothetical protein
MGDVLRKIDKMKEREKTSVVFDELSLQYKGNPP